MTCDKSKELDKYIEENNLPKTYKEACQIIKNENDPILMIGKFIDDHNLVFELDEFGTIQERPRPSSEKFINCSGCDTCDAINREVALIERWEVAKIASRGIANLTFAKWLKLHLKGYQKTSPQLWELLCGEGTAMASNTMQKIEEIHYYTYRNFELCKLLGMSNAEAAKFFEISMWSARKAAAQMQEGLPKDEEEPSHLEISEFLPLLRMGVPLMEIAEVMGTTFVELIQWKNKAISDGELGWQEFEDARLLGLQKQMEVC